MRSPLDRIRHALSFELIALLLVTPLGALLFHQPLYEMGVVTVVSATIATGWNLFYNSVFDRVLMRTHGTTLKTTRQRVVHTVLFEAGLLTVLMPFIAWYLGVTLGQAFTMDVSFSAFYAVYAFVFNWGYDRVFPLPEWAEARQGH